MAEVDASHWGALGGIAGGVLGTLVGLAGGVFGSYCSIKSTRTAAERRFVIRYSVVLWLAIVVLILLPVTLSLLGLIPVWLQWTLFVLFFVLLIPSIGWTNRHLAALGGPCGEDVPPCGGTGPRAAQLRR
jgi:hypothetical protein